MIDQFDWFVLPFAIGFWSMVVILVVKLVRWWLGFTPQDRKVAQRRIFSLHTIKALVEMGKEGLLHMKIFKVSPRLGFMHMSLAFGWFLLIIVGKFQTLAFTGNHVNAVWYPIFFKFFEPGDVRFAFSGIFEFAMDASLLLVLSGVTLAWIKRLAPSALGMKKSTTHVWPDKLALSFLWFVFPLRLLAEGVTASIYGGGSFLTGSLGTLLHPLSNTFQSIGVDYVLWCCYSFVLGGFFLMLPWSRYMHIPAELTLILFRHWGISEKSLRAVEVEACSRCGICIDGCAMLPAGNNMQAVYYVRDVRYGNSSTDKAQSCLMCGSCDIRCPVGIRLGGLRLAGRESTCKTATQLPVSPLASQVVNGKHAKTIYFPGCVGALTPAITQSVKHLMKHSGAGFQVLDASDGLCCGRPLYLSGQADAAERQIAQNSELIASLGADCLVTSCPVCYKMFSQYYQLPMEVMHHTQWIDRMVQQGALHFDKSDDQMVYHDPCELGRGCDEYEAPRRVLSQLGDLQHPANEKDASLCCGGSLGGYKMDDAGRQKIASHAVSQLVDANTDALVTACPMCKKSLAAVSPVRVKDVAEVACERLILAGNNADVKKKGLHNCQLV